MFEILSFIALCVAFASAASVQQSGVSLNTASEIISPLGVVDPIVQCAGVGTPGELRISGCDGYCKFTPETRYYVEQDFIPSFTASQLTVLQYISIGGVTIPILQEDLPNSSVQPGVSFTARYSFVLNAKLGGNIIGLKSKILHSDDQLVESCIFIRADVGIF